METELNKLNCVECEKSFDCQTDILLCDNCQNKFDLDILWEEHDKGKICALDFNENESIREKFRNNK